VIGILFEVVAHLGGYFTGYECQVYLADHNTISSRNELSSFGITD
jgi:hypothetical protein